MSENTTRREYVVLSTEEQDDILVEFLKAQERDLFCHEINRERYRQMLPTLPEGAFKTRVQGLLAETEERIGEVEKIISATVLQLPDTSRINAAKTRIADKESQATGRA